MSEKFRELSHRELRRECDSSKFPFTTTKEVEQLDSVIGQERAVRAIDFGLNVKSPGYNIYVSGLSGTGKTTIVKRLLEKISADMEVPADWCFVNNFKHPDRPNAFSLPAGRGRKFEKEMNTLIDSLKIELPKAFESKNYEEKKSEIIEKYQEMKRQLITKVEERAHRVNIGIKSTPMGFQTIPLIEGKPISQEEYSAMEKDKKKEIEDNISEIQSEIHKTLKAVNLLDKKAKEEINDLNREVALFVVEHRIEGLKDEYSNFEEVVEYLNDVKQDIIENVDDFLGEEEEKTSFLGLQIPAQKGVFTKYRVNVVVDNTHTEGAPVIMETNPTYNNLFGRIEKRAQFGALVTDFTMIKAGSLLRANGGYLMLDAESVLTQPFVWDSLKRTLRNRNLRVEDIGEQYGFLSATGLKPEPIPIDVKVVMIGRSEIFHLLHRYDENFSKIFKVRADFDYESKFTDDHVEKYTQFISKVCGEENLLHFEKTGVAAVIEYGERSVENQDKLSLRFGDIVNVITEASYWASVAGSKFVEREHVEKAIDEMHFRRNLPEEKVQEYIEKGIIMVDVKGGVVGQVNALSIYSYGDFSFGKPTRITAATFVGKGGVINIEREVKLSGRTHDKGVLILSGYLGGKFAINMPLSLSASITFEQTYSEVDGDSASSTELYAILSSLAEIPIDQGIAVTGSVNQRGEVQAIGGVNEKIEGFFDVCKAKGLTGKQGVIIPASNAKNLMLKKEVVEAVKDKKFHIYPIRTVEEGIEILTGVPAGEREEDGQFPEGTVYYRVEEKLKEFVKRSMKFRKMLKEEVEGKKEEDEEEE
ncbi:MAG: Lon protease family protein [Fidelibacterota bacterium]